MELVCGIGFYFLIYLFCIVIPILVFTLEYKGLNISIGISIFRAYVYKTFSNNKKAKQALIEITNKYDNSYLAHKLLAEIYEQEGGMRKAIDEYVKVLDLNSYDSKSYYKISKLLYELDKTDEAIEMLKKLLNNRQENYDAVQLLGKILIEQEEFKTAIEVYSKVSSKYSNDEIIYYNLGIAYARTNEFELAKKSFLRVTEINENNYNAYYRLGQISLLYRDFDSAIKFFKQSICNANMAKVYFELAKIYIVNDDRSKANLAMMKSIETDSRMYQKMLEEPILYSLRENIKKPEKEYYKDFEQNPTEKMIEEYLNDTYNLTKILNNKENDQDKKN